MNIKIKIIAGTTCVKLTPPQMLMPREPFRTKMKELVPIPEEQASAHRRNADPARPGAETLRLVFPVRIEPYGTWLDQNQNRRVRPPLPLKPVGTETQTQTFHPERWFHHFFNVAAGLHQGLRDL